MNTDRIFVFPHHLNAKSTEFCFWTIFKNDFALKDAKIIKNRSQKQKPHYALTGCQVWILKGVLFRTSRRIYPVSPHGLVMPRVSARNDPFMGNYMQTMRLLCERQEEGPDIWRAVSRGLLNM